MVFKRKILIIIIIGLILTGCSNQTENSFTIKIPSHYLIIKSESNSQGTSNAFYTQTLEIKDNKIIGGNISSDQCFIDYLNQTSKYCNFKFENITYQTLQNEVNQRYNLIKEFNQTRNLYWNEKDFLEVYNTKKGCEYNLCYENRIIKKFSKESGSTTSIAVWEIKILE